MRDMHSDFEGNSTEAEASFEALFNEESSFDFEADDEFDLDSEAAQEELDLERTRGRMRRPRSRGTRTQRRRRPSGIGRPLLSRPRPQRIVRPAGRVPSCVCPAHGTEFIRWVQSAINRIFSMSLPVDGVMSRATRDALRRFQQQQGLPADGIAGPDTERAMLDARGGTRVDDAAPTETEPASEFEWLEVDEEELESPSVRPTLRRGSRGAAVVELQQRLTALRFNAGTADGIFGSRTEAAVRAFQRSRSIGVDGIVGSQTWGKLYGRTPAPSPVPAPGTTTPTWVLPADVRAAGDAQTVRYDPPPAWADGKNCATYTDGAADLKRHIQATFPGVHAIGGYNCRANSANASETSVHGVGRALDIMIRPVSGRANSTVGDPIANWLVRNAEAIGVQYIIWNHTRWSGSRTPRVAPYTPTNKHIDHIHVELNLDGARRSTPWFSR